MFQSNVLARITRCRSRAKNASEKEAPNHRPAQKYQFENLSKADDKKKLQKSASQNGIGTSEKTFNDADDFMDELNEKIEKLEQENNQLIKKVDEYKQRYLEAQKSNKVVTSRIDTGLHPSAGPRRTTSGGSLRRPGLRRVETKSESKLNSKSSHTLEIEHRLTAALEENNNMLEAITVLQRKFAEAEAEKYQLKRQIDQKNEMIR